VIVVFGSINIDLVFAVPHIPQPGETVLCPEAVIQPGGKGANQAVAAARDGAAVAMVGAVGRDALAEDALALLKEAGADLTRIARTSAGTACAAVAVDPHGNNAISVGSGANLLVRSAQVEDALLTPATTLVLQMEVDPSQTAALIARAKGRVGRIILNLAPAAALPPESLRALDLLVVNETESAWLAVFLGCADTAPALRSALGVDIVRTLGGDGLEAATDGALLRLPACKVSVVDTTAAGDCFVGVLAAGLDRGMALTPALQRASAAAALCCTRAGSQQSAPRREETDRFIESQGEA
jgi:ribokinase